MKEETTPTVNNPVEPVVSRIDDPNYVFLDDKVSYCHSDFNEEIVDDSCIYLDVEHDVWNGHLEGWSKSTSADSTSIVPMRWPATFSTSSTRPRIMKLPLASRLAPSPGK